jgi:hypothetical protein
VDPDPSEYNILAISFNFRLNVSNINDQGRMADLVEKVSGSDLNTALLSCHRR